MLMQRPIFDAESKRAPAAMRQAVRDGEGQAGAIGTGLAAGNYSEAKLRNLTPALSP